MKNVRISEEAHRRIKHKAVDLGVSFPEALDRLLEGEQTAPATPERTREAGETRSDQPVPGSGAPSIPRKYQGVKAPNYGRKE